MSKRTGRHSAQQNDFLQPSPVTIDSASNVGTNRPYLLSATGTNGQGGAVALVWTLPNDSPPALSYDITTTPTTVTKNTTSAPSVGSPFVFEGLASGVSYTFTVVAKNNSGDSNPTTSESVAVSTVPATPSAPSVRSVTNEQTDYVTIAAPSANGGSAILSTNGYQWESTDSKSGFRDSAGEFGVGQEASTSQQYRVKAINSNGSSEWSEYSGSITTPPYFPPYFPYFPPFFPYFPPFFPFFPPFFPFFPFFPPFFPYFPPFFPYFPPFFPFFPPRFSCIEAETLIETSNGPVAAKDLKVGDTILSIPLDELGTEQMTPIEFTIGSDLTFGSEGLVDTTITAIVESVKTGIIYFNGNQEAKYSSEQPVFIKSDGEFHVRITGNLVVGDTLISVKADGTYEEQEITEITILDGESTVYQFTCDPYHWFIAGGYLVHNKL